MKRVHYVLLALLPTGSAHAEWTPRDYASEYDGCLPRCDKNNPHEHDKCVGYCRCVTDGMQARFVDRDQLMREVIEQKMTDRIASLQKLANGCNQRIWGNPARRLKFR